MAIQTADNKWSTYKWIVNKTAGLGTHTTIQAAITAASSGDAIWIFPGTYDENLTMVAGITLTGDSIENTTINGKITCTYSGLSNIQNINLKDNGDYILECTGSNSTGLNLFGSSISFTAHDAVNLNNANANFNFSRVNWTCSGNFKAVNIVAGNLRNNFGSSAGNSTVASTISGGSFILYRSNWTTHYTSSGTGSIQINECDLSPGNNTYIIGGSGTNLIKFSRFNCGTATCLTINSATSAFKNLFISSNASVIDGSSTLTYCDFAFGGSSSNISTTTQTLTYEGPSKQIGSTNSGNTNSLLVSNDSNTASSSAVIKANVAGGTAADAFYQATVSGTTTWSWGLDNSDSDAFVLAASSALGSTNVLRSDTSGYMSYPLNCCLSYYASLQSNVTGDGTVYTLIFANKIFDQNNNFDGTSTFTAPITGIYEISYFVLMTVDASMTNSQLYLAAGSYSFYDVFNAGAERNSGSNQLTKKGSVIVKMTASQTATLTLTLTGSTKTAVIPANFSYFMVNKVA